MFLLSLYPPVSLSFFADLHIFDMSASVPLLLLPSCSELLVFCVLVLMFRLFFSVSHVGSVAFNAYLWCTERETGRKT